MEVVELYAKEFMEFKKRFEIIGFDLIGSKYNSSETFYMVVEKKKES